MRWYFTSLIALLAIFSPAQAQTLDASAPRVYEVDRLGSTPYKTIASVSKLVRPGDTIKLKPNTGPYREIVMIRVSGEEGKPITFDGGGNVITGFDPIKEWEEKDGVVSYHLKAFPCVLTYKGERLLQDPATNQFTKYADLNEAKDTLTLRAGVDKDGWEFSRRALVVSVNDVAHQIYRNVRASGSTNDGFNLHGVSSDITFENIEGFHNLDEGFSSHDSIQSVIKGAKFWGNDNGIANSYINKDVVSTTLIDTDCYDNLGFGVVLHGCAAKLDNVRIWNNGIRQLSFNDAVITSNKVSVYPPSFTKRQWVSYKESMTSKAVVTYENNKTTITGTPPVIETTNAPAPETQPK